MLTTTETSSSILGGEAQVIVIITISRYRLSSQLEIKNMKMENEILSTVIVHNQTLLASY